MVRSRLEAARKAREVHQQSILKSLQHRLEVARSNGDDKLVRQIEAEMTYSR
jgi:hypothetical protein